MEEEPLQGILTYNLALFRGRDLQDRPMRFTTVTKLPLKECIIALPLVINCSREVMWCRSWCQTFRGRDVRERNSDATFWNPPTQKYVRRTLSQIMSISILRYWALLDTSRSDFSYWWQFPGPYRAGGGAHSDLTGEEPTRLLQTNHPQSRGAKSFSFESTPTSEKMLWWRPGKLNKGWSKKPQTGKPSSKLCEDNQESGWIVIWK